MRSPCNNHYEVTALENLLFEGLPPKNRLNCVCSLSVSSLSPSVLCPREIAYSRIARWNDSKIKLLFLCPGLVKGICDQCTRERCFSFSLLSNDKLKYQTFRNQKFPPLILDRRPLHVPCFGFKALGHVDSRVDTTVLAWSVGMVLTGHRLDWSWGFRGGGWGLGVVIIILKYTFISTFHAGKHRRPLPVLSFSFIHGTGFFFYKEHVGLTNNQVDK